MLLLMMMIMVLGVKLQEESLQELSLSVCVWDIFCKYVLHSVQNQAPEIKEAQKLNSFLHNSTYSVVLKPQKSSMENISENSRAV